MKSIPFYLKIFFAFILFSSILLALFIFLFKNFYEADLQKREIFEVKKTLEYKEKLLTDYIKKVNNKLQALNNTHIFKEFSLDKKNKTDVEDLFKLIMSSNNDILQIKYMNFLGKELIRVDLKNKVLTPIKINELQNSNISEYFKDIRILKDSEIWHSKIEIFKDKGEIIKPLKYILRVVLRVENGFLSIVLDVNNLLNEIQNISKDSSFIIDEEGYFLIGNEAKYNWSRYFNSSLKVDKLYANSSNLILEKNYFESKSFISKRVYLNYKDYIILLTQLKNFENSSLENFKQYLYTIFTVGLIITIILSLIFSEPIAKLNKKTEDENKDLDLYIKKSSEELEESSKIIDKYVMFVKLNSEGIIENVSSALCNASGFLKVELIGHHHKILIHSDMSDKNYNSIWDSLKKGNTFTAEIKASKKDGNFFWVESFTEPVFNQNHEIVGFSIIRNNITDKKIIHELYNDINYKMQQYNAIFENANSGIGLVDLDGNFKKVNFMFSKILGFSNEELLNMSCFDIILKNSKKILRKIFEEAKEIGFISNIEKVFIHKDNSYIHLEMSLNLLPDRKNFVLVVNSLQDKRKLQELNQNLEQRIKEEVEKSRQKDKIHQEEQIKSIKLSSIGSLAAGITHEINTPLTYIKGNFEMMGYDIEDLPNSEIKTRMKEDSQKINEGLNRIANIIESMREISQSSSEIKEEVNIYSTLITSLTMAYNRSKQICKIYLNNKLFTIDNINKDEYTFLSKVQKQRVEQVWIVIINNALDELSKIEDYEKRVLNINIQEDNKNIIVYFEDNAGGINEEILDTIFEPFVSSKTHSGMGVGLNISKKIIEQQNGEIIAYNKNNGAVFEVRLKKLS